MAKVQVLVKRADGSMLTRFVDSVPACMVGDDLNAIAAMPRVPRIVRSEVAMSHAAVGGVHRPGGKRFPLQRRF